MPETREIIRTTCPRDCFDTCGIAVVKRHGVVVHVRGDPQHPVSRGKLCPKCSIGYNREWRDPQARLTRPLRRVGPKGEGRFEPRPVRTGVRGDGFVEITEGLQAGETVVVAANFLIDAESNLKAALSSFTADAQAAAKTDANP